MKASYYSFEEYVRMFFLLKNRSFVFVFSLKRPAKIYLVPCKVSRFTSASYEFFISIKLILGPAFVATLVDVNHYYENPLTLSSFFGQVAFSRR